MLGRLYFSLSSIVLFLLPAFFIWAFISGYNGYSFWSIFWPALAITLAVFSRERDGFFGGLFNMLFILAGVHWAGILLKTALTTGFVHQMQ